MLRSRSRSGRQDPATGPEASARPDTGDRYPAEPTVVVSGLLDEGLGLGEAARGYAAALAAVGCRVGQHRVRLPGRPEPVGDPGPLGLAPLPPHGEDAEADLAVVCLNPPELIALRDAGLRLPAGRANVGVWAWEVDPLPDHWVEMAERLDELWVNTEYMARIVRAAVDVPVVAVPPPLWSTSPLLAAHRAGESGVDTTRFLALCDVASTLQRKNPAGAIRAFVRAFGPGEGPRLTLKLWNGHRDPEGMAELHELARGRDDIEIIDRWLPRDDFAALLASAHVLVSLHRAEGMGLPIFEALHAGVPVVTTRFSGPVELLDDDMVFFVDAAPAAVPPGTPGYPPGAVWGEPDLDHAAAQLRAAWDRPDEARRRAERGRRHVTQAMAPEVIGRRLRLQVDGLMAARSEASPRRPLRPHMQVVAHAAEPWPALGEFLDVVGREARSVDAELVIGAADPGVVPDEHRPAGVRVVVAESRSPFALRAAALAEADADLVVVTEDHCRPAHGWLAAYRAAFAETGTALLAGPIGNGSTRTRADWANYLLGFAAYAPPLEEVPDDRCPTIANCAVDGTVIREAMEKAQAEGTPAWFERHLLPELWRAGETTLVADAAVDHVQPFPWWRHVGNHYFDARCAGAELVDEAEDRPSWRPSALRAQAQAFLRGISAATKDRPELHEQQRRCGWWLRTLALARAVGLVMGARHGAGRAAERLD